jgi:hypothetical protein
MNNYYDDEDLKQFYVKKPKKMKLMGEFTQFLLIACVVCFIASRFMNEEL